MQEGPNYKNQLQEYFQQHYLPLPVYIHTKTLDDQWKSTLTLANQSQYISIAPTKKQADQQSAKEALLSLNLIHNNETIASLTRRIEHLEQRLGIKPIL